MNLVSKSHIFMFPLNKIEQKEISYIWKLVENVQRLLNKHTLIIIFFKSEKPITRSNDLNISISIYK